MNLFTRAPQLADSDWRPDGTGVDSAGDIGGDIQRGESYSVRFVRPDRPRSLVTVSFYATESDNNPSEYGIERQVEFLVCEDPNEPGGTEVWSDCHYDDISYEVIDTEAEAEAEAARHAQSALGDGDDIRWDGYSDPRARFRPLPDHWACWRCGSREFNQISPWSVRCNDCGNRSEAFNA